MLGKHTLELVDGNQLRAPRHIERLDQREEAPVEGRSADAECRGRLRPRVREPLDARRFANDFGWPSGRMSSGVSLRLLTSACQTAARHSYTVHEC